jgi:[protein-PII] uridylyltransferase
LHDARIGTIGERAEDFFHITDFDNQPLQDEARQAALRQEILTALDV